MARHKTFTREAIFDVSYTLVVEEGFDKFTARNIAAKMGCSTQPIYLEFDSMAELREAVMDRIKAELAERFAKVYTSDPVIDMALTYIDFALDDSHLYEAVFVDDHFGVDDLKQFAMSAAMNRFEQKADSSAMTTQQKQNVITGVWVVATGIADLMSSQFIDFTRQQQINILRAAMSTFAADETLTGDAGESFINVTLQTAR